MKGCKTLPFPAAACAAALAAPGMCGAETDLSYGIDAGVGYSDNVTRAIDGGTAETLAIVGGRFTLARESTRMRLDGQGHLDWVEFLQGTYDGQLFGEVRGAARIHLIGESLDWTVEDSFGQARISLLEPITPENLENVNYLTTGPELRLRPTEVDELTLRGQYVDVSYETSVADTRRYLASIEWLHRMGSRRSVAFYASSEHFELVDDPQAADIERREYLLRWSSFGSRGSLHIEAGAVTVDTGGDTESSPVGNLVLTRELSRHITFSAAVGREFTDSGDLFRGRIGDDDADLGLLPQVTTTSVVDSRYASSLWSYARERAAVDLYGEVRDERYSSDLDPDRRITLWRADFRYRLKPRTNVRLYALGFRERFDDLGFDTRERHVGAALEWRIGRRTAAGLEALHLARNEPAGRIEEVRAQLRIGIEIESRAARVARQRAAEETAR